MFFRDVSEIGIGVDFVAHVERAVGASVALIAVIGPTWATASDERGRRLDIADDFVRVEIRTRSEEHTSELQSQSNLVCRLLLEKKKQNNQKHRPLRNTPAQT